MTSLQSIINEIADEADTLLGDVSSIPEAQEALRDHLKSAYPKLSATESKATVTGVIEILKEEGFFEGSRSESGVDEDTGDGFSEQE